jgi:hypothetical protein
METEVRCFTPKGGSMRAMLLTAVLGLAISCSTALGQESNRAVIDSFDVALDRVYGVEWVQELGLMYLVDEGEGIIYTAPPEGGATLVFDINDVLGYNPGTSSGVDICYVPGSSGREASLFVTHMAFSDKVYEFTTDGAHLNTWTVTAQCGSGGPSGITFDGTYFWMNCGYNVVKCDTEFNVLDSFVNPGYWGLGTHGGLDYDPHLDVLYLMQYYPGDIYVIDLSDYSTLDTFPAPTEDACGLSVGRVQSGRARSLWTTGRTSGRVYEIDDVHDTPAEVGSWGTIKAIHR